MARTRTEKRRRVLPTSTGALLTTAAGVVLGVQWLIANPAVLMGGSMTVITGLVGWVTVTTRRATANPRRMKPREFEHYVARQLRRSGHRKVIVSGGSGDLGADVTAEDRHGRRIVVQCKRYGPKLKVGSPDVQRFVGTARPRHDADVAVIVTTSKFTDPAQEYAHEQAIVCVDGDALKRWDSTRTHPWT